MLDEWLGAEERILDFVFDEIHGVLIRNAVPQTIRRHDQESGNVIKALSYTRHHQQKNSINNDNNNINNNNNNSNNHNNNNNNHDNGNKNNKNKDNNKNNNNNNNNNNNDDDTLWRFSCMSVVLVP